MNELLVICGTVLICAASVLWFLHYHLADAKAWRKELEDSFAKFEPRIKDTEETAKTHILKIEQYFKDLEKVNQNQLSLATELQTIKNRQGLQGGMLGRNNPVQPN
jgi:hypothetical protein